ncbi:hypothetical protein BV898_16341 [Hypsibius exemplaris]|uniref:Uncharacterized protein n=1 Tax=Hypsibius exemplaris TaxID=2072580 RepID=A0A9X6NDE6_HYPEX|nr:hypothetical protein BV898_16341 [Hypsibius exemplaris]
MESFGKPDRYDYKGAAGVVIEDGAGRKANDEDGSGRNANDQIHQHFPKLTKLWLEEGPGLQTWTISACSGAFGGVHLALSLPVSAVPPGGAVSPSYNNLTTADILPIRNQNTFPHTPQVLLEDQSRKTDKKVQMLDEQIELEGKIKPVVNSNFKCTFRYLNFLKHASCFSTEEQIY